MLITMERIRHEEPWPYTDALYRKDYGDIRLACAIAPAYKDVRVIVTHRESRIHELNAVGVKDVRYFNDKRGELLEIVLSPDETMLMWVKPQLEIRHSFSNRSRESS